MRAEKPKATLRCAVYTRVSTEARALLIDALGDAHRWLDELTTTPDQTIGTIAMREGQTER